MWRRSFIRELMVSTTNGARLKCQTHSWVVKMCVVEVIWTSDWELLSGISIDCWLFLGWSVGGQGSWLAVFLVAWIIQLGWLAGCFVGWLAGWFVRQTGCFNQMLPMAAAATSGSPSSFNSESTRILNSFVKIKAKDGIQAAGDLSIIF